MTGVKEIKLLCVGECMMELLSQDEKIVSGFAGDIINFCVYLKRLSPGSSVEFLSAVGQDLISEKMITYLGEEGIGTSLVAKLPDKTIGLYLIQNDAEGERTFTYWRSDSAARQMFLDLDEASLVQSFSEIDYFYFSGISLAILDQTSRDRLLTLAQTLSDEGKTIIFDPNLRPTLWPSMEEAKTQTTGAFKVCDLLLSSYEDDHSLFGDTNIDSIFKRFSTFGIDEIILTNGDGEINGASHGERFTATPAKPETIVDTTAAGDSFNAGYLIARHSGCSARESVVKASSLAALVIGHNGAIIPREATDNIDE